MKQPREVSGIYFRFKNLETNKWENWVFEDLPEAEQDRILNGFDPEAVKRIAKILANKLYSVCEQFDITTIQEERDEDEMTPRQRAEYDYQIDLENGDYE